MSARKFLKVAIPADLHGKLIAGADERGLKLADHVRGILTGAHQAVEVEDVLAQLDARLSTPVAPVTTGAPSELEPLVVEALLLVRELAADRNAQVLARVAQKLNALYPGRART